MNTTKNQISVARRWKTKQTCHTKTTT